MLCKYAWQYNGEYYDMPDGDPASPVLAYHDKERAEDACLQKNIQALVGLEIAGYSSDGLEGLMAYGLPKERLLDFLRKEFDLVVEDGNQYEITLPRMTLRQGRALLRLIHLRFWMVVEVPVRE